MKEAGFDLHDVLDIQLAIEESVTNTIRHGYCGTPGPIIIHGEAGPDMLIINITDQAPEFNPLCVPVPDTTSPLEERKIGGLGVHLIRQVTDSVSYQYQQGKNILTLIKKRKKMEPELLFRVP